MNNEDIFDPRIDTALDSLPLEDLPPGFTARLMAQIEPRPGRARFRQPITFLDFALPLFFILFFSIAAIVSFWGLKQIDPLFIRRLELEASWQLQRFTPDQFVFAAMAAGLGIAALVTGFFSLSNFLNPQPTRLKPKS